MSHPVVCETYKGLVLEDESIPEGIITDNKARSDKLDENSHMPQVIVGWKMVLCVMPSDFCRMELDGMEWNVFRFI